ncbi:Vitamin K-dependent gamma-carboxylase [Enhygromyxa salina]|uniref:Vitamin K-dependent gamma-carboxylase n=1 Tax=Enhygromyxa salina TaxID=215803 RepID=A0A0C2CXJ8_9BACT|nr:HTTM domain-containing protein [Enhygromyxa salina]KIG14365.1 Vitamin K-dependent gamma-carboxylase [Enhygromyxa salina]
MGPGCCERARAWSRQRVDASSLVILRVFVGLLVCVSALRFVARGWVDELLLAPSFHFHYWGFAWVQAPTPTLAYGLFAVLAAASLAFAAGLRPRLSALTCLLAFTYIELIDLSYYLNHYYFISCLLATFVLLPPVPDEDARVSQIQLTLVRVQVGLVYLYAGIAKIGADWLVYAQPLKTWLARRADLPLVGAWLDEAWLAHLASWSGLGFDLLVVPALLWRPTRAYAYVAVVGFHVITGLLFPIGMFPWFMIGCATIMFAPDWPRRFMARDRTPASTPIDPRLKQALTWAAGALLLVQIALPWRSLLYPGSSLWHEQGFRFGYRVMLIEKVGFAEFRVHDRATGRRWKLDPHAELSPLQVKMMSTQPDLIAQYARHLAARLEREMPGSAIEIRADVFVAFNGRPHHRLIDPNTDLAATREGLAAKPWILPAPTTHPP